MLNFIARRIAAGALLLVVISFLSYLLLSIPGADVGRQLLGQSADQAAVDAKNASLGLDRSGPGAVRRLAGPRRPR